jgi:phosphatidylglycerol---prolipoprotein diacylglyceryl transferase
VDIHLNHWELTILGKSYSLSPFLILNGIALILGLMLLDAALKTNLPCAAKRIYILFVLSLVVGWGAGHTLDWAVTGKSFEQAGFTFYGGLIGGALFFSGVCAICCGKQLVFPSLNAAVIPVVVGHAIGRIGCFLGGCCHGVPVSEENPLRLLCAVHPAQLYESLFLLLLVLFLLKLRKERPMLQVHAYIICYSVLRFFVEFLRGDERGAAFGFSTSQWISSSLLILAILHGCMVSLRSTGELYIETDGNR